MRERAKSNQADKERFERAFGPFFERIIDRMVRGAKKHGPVWPSKPLYEYEISLVRHTIRFLSGCKKEDHGAAIACNIRTIEERRKKARG